MTSKTKPPTGKSRTNDSKTELPSIVDDKKTSGSNKLVNPFHMPSDEEIFARRDEERQLKEEERRKQLTLPVHLKGTWTSKTSSVDKDFLKTNVSRTAEENKKADMMSLTTGAERHHREKENMADFIAKKREMFLVQMSLDTKRADIRKLEEQAQQREEALRKSEQMLDEDSVRFDAFLKENDYKAVEAIRKAEAETKAKQDKVQEIKKLVAQIAAVKSEMSKYEEQLEDCKRYRDFLNKLTPEEWKLEQAQKRAQRKAEKRAKREAERMAKAAEEAQLLAAQQEEESNAKGKDGKTKGPKKEKKSAKDSGGGGGSSAGNVNASSSHVDVDDDSDSEEEDMYFQRPEQLLEIFAALEERNLFLIQNSQETEGALEELKQKLEETKGKMDAETETLKSQISQLKAAIQMEQDKAQLLSERAKPQSHIAANTTSAQHHQQQQQQQQQQQEDTDALLEKLNKSVTEVYERCGFEMDAPLGTLGMLANIEARLEEYLSIINKLPQNYVEEAERTKEKERRQRVREEKLEQQRKAQDERIARSIERSKAPVKKKTGKTVMFRAPPLQKRRKEKEIEIKTDDEDEDIKEFFTE